MNPPWWALPNTPPNSSANSCTSICLKSVRRSKLATKWRNSNPPRLASPVAGTIRYVNNEAADDPSIVTDDPYGEGWIFKIELEDDEPDLLSADEYAKIVAD